MGEIRWILLGLGVLLILGIWWWGSRRSTQAPGMAELREPTLPKDPEPLAPREWNPPFEPVSMRATDVERVPVPEVPIVVDIAPITHEFDPRTELSLPVHEAGTQPPVLIKVAGASPSMEAAPVLSQEAQIAEKLSTTSPIAVQKDLPPPIPKVVAPAREKRPTAPPAPSPDQSDRISTTAPQAANTSERQRIVAIRVCAPGEMRWSGQALLSALEANGLAYGRYQVFHRKHVDGRSLFCVANIKEPGNFDVSQMPAQEFKGISLFAVLPGPLEPVLTVDELLGAARDLAGALTGMVQDARGLPLSPQRAVALREDVARFQASLGAAPGP